MASITIKNIPERLYEKLKFQAKVRHRSLNSEIIHCLEEATGGRDFTADEIRERARLFSDNPNFKSAKS